WGFHQLGRFIVYKAKRVGVPLVYADPAYTSQRCSQCGHIERGNRQSQATFACRSCGFLANADDSASHNIARKGETVWTAGRGSRAPATPKGCLNGGANPAAS
ncbi:zinc ribbon domain-containing protein, partial [Streptomyces sp. NPDC056549]|uniref:zinc ribbon domain-containing protein n=1 Tax=Streptomyces sp. NPDC056549 TaxID=3345864 RepID=UPI0036A691DC